MQNSFVLQFWVIGLQIERGISENEFPYPTGKFLEKYQENSFILVQNTSHVQKLSLHTNINQFNLFGAFVSLTFYLLYIISSHTEIIT